MLVLAAAVTLLATGCASKHAPPQRAMSEQRPTLPKIRERFTLLPCPRKGRARGTTLGIEGCYEHEIVRTDAKITARSRRIFAALTPAGRKAFARAERAWLAHRESFCTARASIYAGGSAQPLVFAACVVRMNRAHLDRLTEFQRDLQH